MATVQDFQDTFDEALAGALEPDGESIVITPDFKLTRTPTSQLSELVRLLNLCSKQEVFSSKLERLRRAANALQIAQTDSVDAAVMWKLRQP